MMRTTFGKGFLCVAVLGLLIVGGQASAQQLIDAKSNLNKNDNKNDSDSYYKQYKVEVKAGQFVQLKMTSVNFDTYLTVTGPKGQVFENDDPSEFDFNAAVRFVAPQTGTYTIVATSSESEAIGRFHLTGSADVAQLVNSIQGSLDEGDKRIPKHGEFMDELNVAVPRGERRVVSLTSEDFDGFLSVEGPSGEIYSADDPPVLILEGGDDGGEYKVIITSFEANETGKYKFEVHALGNRPV